jgi:RNA polymerase sigma factor (sigma-70 family)
MSPGISTRLLATQSDERLLALARDGHERAFEALVLRYRKPLLGYCRRLSLPEPRIEDVLQQALLKTWIALHDGAEVHDIKAWLYRVVHNTAVNAMRDATRERERLSDPTLRVGASSGDLERGLVARETLSEVAALPELQREVIVRTAVGGYSHEQVASDLGITDGAVRGLLYRARVTLRTAITALTPPPLLGWIAGRAEQASSSAGVPEALGGVAAGGSAAGAGSLGGIGLGGGLGGLLVKGGAVALTAGTLITGAVVHLQGSERRRPTPRLAAEGRGAHEADVPSTSSVRPAGAPSRSRPPLHASGVRGGRSRRGGVQGVVHLGGTSTPVSAGQRAAGGAPSPAPAVASPAPRRIVSVSVPTGTQSPPAGSSGENAPTGQGTSGGGQQSPVGSAAGAGSAGSAGTSGGGSAEAKAAGGSGDEQSGSGGQAGSGASGSGGSGSGSGAGGSGSEGSGSTGSSGSGSGGSGSGGSDSGGGSGESQSQSEGGLVGKVVHEVGNLLEHVLH